MALASPGGREEACPSAGRTGEAIGSREDDVQQVLHFRPLRRIRGLADVALRLQDNTGAFAVGEIPRGEGVSEAPGEGSQNGQRT